MASDGPVRLAVAGIGGYAKEISNLILGRGPEVSPAAQLVAVCDPAVASHATRAEELRAKGVQVFEAYDQMLAEARPDGVWLPVPIPLHLPFAEQALRAGVGVMVEKPAAGCLDDVDAMIALRDRYRLPLLVGFQDVYDRGTLPLKRRILAGEFGRIESVTLHACWPRTDHYFGRAGWAGRVRVGDTWVLDSPANNALAHFVNIVLFLLGPTEETSARATSVEAELYRAAPIENYDTISARVHLEGGATFLILLTHACSAQTSPVSAFHGERGSIVRTPSSLSVTVDGATTTTPRDRGMLTDMLQRFAGALRGVHDPEIALGTLEVAREHTRIISAASQAAPIRDVPATAVDLVETDHGAIRAIRGIDTVFAHCAERGQMLHESGLFGFTRPGSVIDTTNYEHFAGLNAHATRTASATT